MMLTSCAAPYSRWFPHSCGLTAEEIREDPSRAYCRLRIRGLPEQGGDQCALAEQNCKTLTALYSAESEAIRDACRDPEIGLALSGGGIRSASFATGVLQGLAEIGLLDRIGYLSTVSGGGYAGSWYLAHAQAKDILAPGSQDLDRLAQNGHYLTTSHASRSKTEFVSKLLVHGLFWPFALAFDEAVRLEWNVYGLRDFYRQGLKNTFLYGDEDLHQPGNAWPCPLDRIREPHTLAKFLPCNYMSIPFWIANAHLVLRHERTPEYRSRSGDAFEITPLRAGADAVGYVTVPPRADSSTFWMRPDYAVAISGAALDSDSLAVPPPASTLSYISNADLGYFVPAWGVGWLRGDDWWMLKNVWWLLSSPFPINRIIGMACPDSWFFPHRFRRDAKFFGLTDGGHFDNLGLYALVRRGCRLIVIADAGQDPAVNEWTNWAPNGGRAFSDLRKVAALIESDFGADLKVHWDEFVVHPEGGGMLRAEIANLPVEGRRQEVCILLLKAALPPYRPLRTRGIYVDKVALDHPEFPHEDIFDQFFVEDEILAYRRIAHDLVLRERCALEAAANSFHACLPRAPCNRDQ